MYKYTHQYVYLKKIIPQQKIAVNLRRAKRKPPKGGYHAQKKIEAERSML